MLIHGSFGPASMIYAENHTGSLFTNEPPIEQNFLWNGVISSEVNQLPGREDNQAVMILNPRQDSGVYSGVLTYHASRPVNLTIWNMVELGNVTAIPENYGKIQKIVELEGSTIVLQEIASGASASIPFVGNAIELIAREPFIVSYAVNALTALPKIISDIEEAMTHEK